MLAEEVEEREEVLAEVMDPDYLMGRDADGEGDVEGEVIDREFETAGDVDHKGMYLSGDSRSDGDVNSGGVKDKVVTGGSVEMVDVMEVW